MTTRLPPWIRRSWPSGEDFTATRELLRRLNLHTVCQSARCPNIGECWQRRTATVLILGKTCTRNCRYCSVPSGRPKPIDPGEPRRVAEAVRQMRLRHAVITSVTRDDLPDGGAAHFAQTIEAVRATNPNTTVEVLAPDFRGDRHAINAVLGARPDVFSHNIETVARLHPAVRSRESSYPRTLDVLRTAAAFSPAGRKAARRGRKPAPRLVVKSGLMVGHGETPEEVRQTLVDLLEVGCVAVCIGQYLQPTIHQLEVAEFVPTGQFKLYEEIAYSLGFSYALAGPFVRSSYWSDEMVLALSVPHGLGAARRRQPCGMR